MPDEETRSEGTPGTETTGKDKAPEIPAEIQSYVDNRITKGIATGVENVTTKLRAEFETAQAAEVARIEKEKEREQLVADGKHKDLAEQLQADLDVAKAENALAALDVETAEMLQEKGLGDLLPVFASDLSSLKGRTEVADVLAALVATAADAKTKAALGTADPPPKGKAPPATGSLGEQLKAANAAGDIEVITRITNEMANAQAARMR